MGEHDDWDIVSGVGITALGVAAARALESARDDALIDDRYAESFVTRAATPVPLPTSWASVIGLRDGSETDQRWATMWATMANCLGVRSRFFDDCFLDACTAGIRQMVILAAGLDTRAFRLSWPPRVDLFELDMPKVLEFKDSVLADYDAVATCTRHVVPIDLRADWPEALLAAGFVPHSVTAWLAEGLLPYLPGTAVETLFTNVHRLSAPGSRLAVEVTHPDMRAVLHDPAVRDFQHRLGMNMATLWSQDNRPDPARWFRDHDWQATSTSAAQAANHYHRWLDGCTLIPWGKTTLLTIRCN